MVSVPRATVLPDTVAVNVTSALPSTLTLPVKSPAKVIVRAVCHLVAVEALPTSAPVNVGAVTPVLTSNVLTSKLSKYPLLHFLTAVPKVYVAVVFGIILPNILIKSALTELAVAAVKYAGARVVPPIVMLSMLPLVAESPLLMVALVNVALVGTLPPMTTPLIVPPVN